MAADPSTLLALRQHSVVSHNLAVPLLRDDAVMGAICIGRTEVRPFSERQISLIETFADQAVIAIENTRLFEAVQARNRDLTALGEVGRAVSSDARLEVVLKTIVDRAVDLSDTDAGRCIRTIAQRCRCTSSLARPQGSTRRSF